MSTQTHNSSSVLFFNFVFSSTLLRVQEYDFHVRWPTVRLLTVLLTNRPKDLQECLLVVPMAVSKLMDLLSDSREIIRNDVSGQHPSPMSNSLKISVCVYVCFVLCLCRDWFLCLFYVCFVLCLCRDWFCGLT